MQKHIVGYEKSVCEGATIVVGTETGTVDITIQLTDYAGNPLTEAACVMCYVSSDATGLTHGDFDSMDITSSGAGDCLEVVADIYWQLISEEDGTIAVTPDGSGADTMYLNLILPNGKIVHSDVITFTE